MSQNVSQIISVAQLRELYRAPNSFVQAKVKPTLDPVSTKFIQHCPFLLIATRDELGRVDVSPRGGPAGFVNAREDGTIAIPDLNGNNLLDTLENIVATGRVATLFLQPGQDETLRVNGTAIVTTDSAVLDAFTTELRRPKSAIVIQPDEVFIHCAKAFRRGGVWQPDSWSTDGPDGIDILRCQFDIPGDEATLRASFAEGYVADLAQD